MYCRDMISQSHPVDSKEVLKCLFAVSQELTPDQIEKYKQNSKLIKNTYTTTKNSKTGVVTGGVDPKAVITWNREVFVKNLQELCKPDWTQVIMELDNAELVIDSKELFNNLLGCLIKAKQQSKA
jgi:hypothetical protein